MTISENTVLKLLGIIQSEFENLEIEKTRFKSLIGQTDDLETGPSGDDSWQKIELYSNRLKKLYDGFERIFTQILKTIDEDLPSGENWHEEVLQAMYRETSDRPQVLTDDIDILDELRRFRHMTRNNYPHELSWDLMKKLIKNYENLHERIKKEIKGFLDAIEIETNDDNGTEDGNYNLEL